MKFKSLALSSALLASAEASASEGFAYGPDDEEDKIQEYAEQKIWDLITEKKSSNSNNLGRTILKKASRGLRSIQGEVRNGKGKLSPTPIKPSCSIGIEIGTCDVFVSGSTTPIPCDNFEPTSTSTTCDVSIQYTYTISNTEVNEPSFAPFTGPTAKPSAVPSAEPTSTASPTGSRKSGQGKSRKTTRNDGKGRFPAPGAREGVVPDTLFQQYNGDPDGSKLFCPDSVSTLDIHAGMILAPGESISVTGSLIEINVCACSSSIISVGVTGNPAAASLSGKGKTSIEEEGDDAACAAVAVAVDDFLLEPELSSAPSSVQSQEPSSVPSSVPSNKPSSAPSSCMGGRGCGRRSSAGRGRSGPSVRFSPQP